MNARDRGARERATEIARRVERNARQRRQDPPPLERLVAATALLFADGFRDPRDRSVLGEAEALGRELAAGAVDPGEIAPASDRAAREWAGAREALERELPAGTFEAWIAPLRATGELDGTLRLAGPLAVARWAERRYGQRILRLAPRARAVEFMPTTTKEDTHR